MNFIKQHFATILIAVAIVFTGAILGKSYLSKGKPDDTVSVIGLGEKSFDSDLIVWRASFSRKGFELKDAHERAAKIAENGGGSLGKLKTADMGVFQITAENSSEEYEWGGSFNTSSRRKTASVTIRLNYAID